MQDATGSDTNGASTSAMKRLEQTAPAYAHRLYRSLSLPTGVTLPYVEQGTPNGIPVVMLHGITDSWRSFEPVLPLLPQSIHAFALSQRGHGDASRPAGTYRTRDFAADAAAFIDALDLGPAVIVGHSMGSTNALRLAIDRPELVRGLVLIGAFSTYRGNAALVEFCESAVATLTDPVPLELARDFQRSTLAQPVTEDFFDMVVSECLKVPAHVWRDVSRG